MDPEISIDCPQQGCNATMKVRVSEVARGATKRCPNGHSVKLVDDGGGFREAQRAAEDFERAMRDLGAH